MLKEKELCYRITGCVYEVYRHLGAGFLESVYQKALIQELQFAGLAVQCEVPVVIHYKGEPIAEHRVDLLVENAVIIELKAQKQMPISAEPQLINYLKATGKELGLLVNFSFPKAVVKRVVL
ncbi:MULTISPECIES: GxxExxY protein [Marinobacter]|jgi:GxxExxY protein|uniref:GxxExxY protein n=1 Tax=Marinobacter metalliresistant TaxID=2961995 RepID=A0ABZ2W4P4_9GAMM|nr:GxxExxY protein [Marinobacter sp.]MAK51985.1 GxxExxY protein [Marinobacter sp.]MBC7185254.1 GxxExxY protein [Marinobacter sp.]PTB95373.1 GxxExxY protein [Marinobacter sp. B9-2]PTB98627.1 GxxExxY protein [Marinobacter sp. Z-F4-2]|tara:strand:- start:242 stop:607 length:366 start_codon:yes stop_codon:yes gene_type:complete